MLIFYKGTVALFADRPEQKHEEFVMQVQLLATKHRTTPK